MGDLNASHINMIFQHVAVSIEKDDYMVLKLQEVHTHIH